MRQVQSSVDHARNRFSEPVPKAYGFVLRAVLAVHTRISVPKEGDVDLVPHARQAQCVHERMSERVKHLRTVSDPMCPYVPSEPLREGRLAGGSRCHLGE